MTWVARNTKITIPAVLIDVLTELHVHKFSAIGGLYLDRNGEVQVGRTIDETFCLNLGGPYATYADLVAGQVNSSIRLIKLHEKLEFMRDAILQLERFKVAVSSNPERAPELNKVKLRLPHHRGRDDADSGDEKQRVLYLFEERCEQKGVSIPQESAYSSPLQDSMQKAADFLRAITEVAPRDQRKELVAGWKANLLPFPSIKNRATDI
ncbi:hypothetical protein F4819DRAFT_491518 [Hypoxylon fuscum]|nr:hypothetical protein F4819DRAFT_491518 [Hypoxylon fuscum]